MNPQTAQAGWSLANVLTVGMLASLLFTVMRGFLTIGRRFGVFEERQEDGARRHAELLKAVEDHRIATAARFKEHEIEDEVRFQRQNASIDALSGNLRELMGALRVALPELDRRIPTKH